jgi:hypothetical protein
MDPMITPARMSMLERVAVTAVTGVGIATATTSFHALTGLHTAAGAPPWLAPMLPIAFDGMITAASLAVVAARRAARPATYSWFLVGLYTSLSVAGNALHAAVPDLGPGGPLAAGIAAVFPLTLFLSFEQLLRITTLTRHHPPHTAQNGTAETSAETGESPLAARTGREAVAALLDCQQAAGRDPWALTGPAVAAATGLSVRRAQELLAQLRDHPTPADIPDRTRGGRSL